MHKTWGPTAKTCMWQCPPDQEDCQCQRDEQSKNFMATLQKEMQPTPTDDVEAVANELAMAEAEWMDASRATKDYTKWTWLACRAIAALEARGWVKPMIRAASTDKAEG